MTDLSIAHNDWLDPDSPRRCRVPEVPDEWLEDRRLDERMEMMAIEDGGPAFPINGYLNENTGDIVGASPGMSLRDYLAGQAMVGLLASGKLDIPATTWASLATDAFDLADAMLAESKKAKQ